MRIASSGDWHVDEHNRFAETLEILNWFVQDITLQRPDLICIGGDSAPVSVRPMTPVERNALASVYQRLATVAPVFIVKGNHDCADADIDIFSRLQSDRLIRAFSTPAVVRGFTESKQPFVFGALPWPSKGFLMARARQDGIKLDDVNAACREAMRALLMRMRLEFDEEVGTTPHVVRILSGHLNVTGSDVGGFALVGQDVEVGSADLEATGADVVLLGHIHKRQSFGSRVHYPGSIRRVDFGEEGEEKGYLLIDVEPGLDPKVEFRQAPGRVMQTIHVAIGEGTETYDGLVTPGAELRVIVDVDEERRSTLDEAQILQNMAGAGSVKLEYRVTPKQRVRAPEIREARTDADRLRAWMGSLSSVPDELTAGRLLLKLDRIAGAA